MIVCPEWLESLSRYDDTELIRIRSDDIDDLSERECTDSLILRWISEKSYAPIIKIAFSYLHSLIYPIIMST